MTSRFSFLVAPLQRQLAPVATDAWVGFRNVFRQKRRSAFGISAVAFGVVAVLLSGGFVQWVFWAAREGTIQAGLGHIQIVRRGFFDTGLSDPFNFLLPENPSELKLIADMKGVRTVAPRISFSGLVSAGESSLSFVGEGVDPDSEARFGYPSIISQGQDLAADDPKGIILGRGLAENLGVNVGDTVVLLATTRDRGLGAVECKVRGTFTTVSKAYDDSALRVPREVAEHLIRVKGAHRWIIVLRDTGDTVRVIDALEKALPSENLQFVPWFDLADYYNKTVTLLSKQMAFVRLVISIIIVLCISNSLLMNVVERTSEIGTSMALGLRRANVLRRFLSEGLALGVLGGLTGTLLGVGLALLISWIGIPMPPPPGMSGGYRGEIMLTWQLVLGALALACGTALVASVYPAWKASRLVIVDALRRSQ